MLIHIYEDRGRAIVTHALQDEYMLLSAALC